jgi:hypothetical protein
MRFNRFMQAIKAFKLKLNLRQSDIAFIADISNEHHFT